MSSSFFSSSKNTNANTKLDPNAIMNNYYNAITNGIVGSNAYYRTISKTTGTSTEALRTTAIRSALQKVESMSDSELANLSVSSGIKNSASTLYNIAKSPFSNSKSTAYSTKAGKRRRRRTKKYRKH
jgi:hypothetical protein